jgi:hypothetical protein
MFLRSVGHGMLFLQIIEECHGMVTDEEIARRRDAALLRALSTPHKPHSEMKLGKPKPKADEEANPKKRGRPHKGKGA